MDGLDTYPPTINEAALPARPVDVVNRSSEAVTDIYKKAAIMRGEDIISGDSLLVQPGKNRVDALKDAVTAKRRRHEDLEAVRRDSQAEIERLDRLKSLPKLCDMLRVLFSRRRKTTAPFRELIRTLAAETGVDVEEQRTRLNLICEIIPDFLSIFPPDDVVPEEFVKMNIHCKYDFCMDRLNSEIRAVK